MCPNHSTFTKWAFKRFRTYEEHKLVELGPRVCRLHIWDNHEEDKLVREVFGPPKS